MALIYQPKIFSKLPGVRSALSLRGTTRLPFGFNMSLSVGDDESAVLANRSRLASRLGFDVSRLVTQRQVHGDVVVEVRQGYSPGESDAMITRDEGWLLAVSVADCVPILIYDEQRRAVAAVHSGWRGTQRNIVGRTIAAMAERYDSDPASLRVYIGASAGQCCYEVRDDVASLFEERYRTPVGGGAYLFDNRGVVLDQVLESGVVTGLVELDTRCTICGPTLHSYRRDGPRSGRTLAVIGMNTSLAEGDSLETA